MKKTIKIGTRSSKLAVKQVRILIKSLQKAGFGRDFKFEIVEIKTSGDKIVNDEILDEKSGFKGVFTKEIQQALIAKKIDIAVHSMKDLPVVIPDTNEICCILKRKNREDGFFSFKYENLHCVPKGGTIGTSSIRRRALIKTIRPDLKIVGIRGNIDTRLEKMKNQELDGIILSYCGPRYLKYKNRIKFSSKIKDEKFICAIGQGAIGVEILKENDDKNLRFALSKVCDEKSKFEVEKEKMLAILINASCQMPLACSVQEKKCGNFEIKASYVNMQTGHDFFEKIVCKKNAIDQKIVEIAEKIKKII